MTLLDILVSFLAGLGGPSVKRLPVRGESGEWILGVVVLLAAAVLAAVQPLVAQGAGGR
jgi:putative copper export protein